MHMTIQYVYVRGKRSFPCASDDD